MILLLMISSCSIDENESFEADFSKQSIFSVSKIKDKELISRFIDFKKSFNSGKRTLAEVNFDESEVFEITINSSDSKILMINQEDFDPNSNFNFGFSIPISKNGEFGSPMIVKTEKLNNDKLSISYFEYDMDLILNVELDGQSKSIEFIAPKSSNNRILCGDETMGCLADAYTNHGWVSVWATVQTAFIPWTAVGLAAGCAAANCL